MTIGRPRIEFDLKTVEGMGAIHATQVEMADVFGVSYQTVKRRLDDPDDEFCIAYKRGLSEGKTSIRRALFRKAQKGDIGAIVWWTKQHLGMMEPRDRIMDEKVVKLQADLDELKREAKGSPDADA